MSTNTYYRLAGLMLYSTGIAVFYKEQVDLNSAFTVLLKKQSRFIFHFIHSLLSKVVNLTYSPQLSNIIFFLIKNSVLFFCYFVLYWEQ